MKQLNATTTTLQAVLPFFKFVVEAVAGRVSRRRWGRSNRRWEITMKIILVRFAALITGCGWVGYAYCIPVFGGTVTLQADVFDPALTLNNSKHVFLSPPPVSDRKGVAGTNTLSASVGSNTAVTDVSVRSQPGLLAVFASASASATNTQINQNLNSVASASTLASAGMADEWNLHVGHKVRKKHVTASFKLTSQLTTTANGVNGTPANGFHDNVDSDARALLRVFGTGIPPGLYPSHGPDVMGFFEDAVLSATINPHIRDNPPATIPVSFDIEEESMFVSWSLIAQAQVSVLARDVINHLSGLAIGISDVAHTFTWGGITSITDADTGALITDFTLTSASGFDYTQAFPSGPIAVPEPPSVLLLTAGLVASLALMVRRRQRAQV